VLDIKDRASSPKASRNETRRRLLDARAPTNFVYIVARSESNPPPAHLTVCHEYTGRKKRSYSRPISQNGYRGRAVIRDDAKSAPMNRLESYAARASSVKTMCCPNTTYDKVGHVVRSGCW